MKRNTNLAQLQVNYLFPEIIRCKREYLLRNPEATIISLGIGDTSAPIPDSIVNALVEGAARLGDAATYTGYGPENGIEPLRQAIASTIYADQVMQDEIYVSDGTKCDIGRLMLLFGREASLAVQDPSYPVYIDSAMMMGLKQIVLMPCSPENGFFPHLDTLPRTDVIAFCSPNNPTGAAATRPQLEALVQFARKNRSVILYDAAYAAFIRDPAVPRSIYEIEGAREVAIELGSFSKLIGFTGVRLGWTVIPKELKFDDGTPVARDWTRIISTVFNGASNIAQQGGLAVMSKDGLQKANKLVDTYMANASLLASSLRTRGCPVYGGVNAPYLWVHFPGRKSWDTFYELLEQRQLLTTPGSGFGPSGEGFIRLTAFGSEPQLRIAIDRLTGGAPLLLPSEDL